MGSSGMGVMRYVVMRLGEGRWWSHIEQVINIINRHLNYRINYVYTKNNFNTAGMNLLQQDLDSINIWNAYLHFNTSINALCLVLTLNLLPTIRLVVICHWSYHHDLGAFFSTNLSWNKHYMTISQLKHTDHLVCFVVLSLRPKKLDLLFLILNFEKVMWADGYSWF